MSAKDNPFLEEPFFRTYAINPEGLGPGIHHFRFIVDNEFFSYLPFSPIRQGHVVLKVTADRHSEMLHLTIRMDGWVEVVCDRCLEPFQYPIHSEKRLIIKFTPKVKQIERDQELMLVPPGITTLYLAQDFYDYILLELPMQITHPDPQACNREVLEILNHHQIDTADSSSSEKKEIDPRWASLQQLLHSSSEAQSQGG